MNGDLREQFVSMRLAQRCFRRVQVSLGCVDGGLRCLQTGLGFVAGFRAHNALTGERDGACGVGFLMVEVRLGLRQGCLRGLYLRFGGLRGAGGFAVILALSHFCFPQLCTIAGGGSLGGLQCSSQILALNFGDELARLDRIAFLDGELLNAARDF